MTRQRKLQPAEGTNPEPLSPELVLVDPLLANLARERLPSERTEAERTSPGSPDERPSAISPDYAEDHTSSFARPRRRSRGVLAAALAVLAVAVVGFAILAHELTDIRSSVNGRTPTRTESIHVQPPDARQNRRTTERLRAGAGTALPHSTKPAAEPRKRPQGVRPSEFATRLFVWPAVSRATFYRVEFFRRGRKIFKASPTIPRIELPLSWVFRGRHFRLRPATYKWEVRAAFGPRSRPRYGKLITRSMWTAR